MNSKSTPTPAEAVNPPTSTQPVFTTTQQDVISARDQNILVSASAGTGKTTVMLERICRLLAEEGVELNQILVVTFTNLAAAEMKNRMVEKLSRDCKNPKIEAALDNVDACSISTLHSFCSDILRNYFYIVDIDPSYTILDTFTVTNLKNQCMSEVLSEYYDANDEVFEDVYQIFQKRRDETPFKDQLFSIFDFSRCLVDFGKFYQMARQNFLNLESPSNPISQTLIDFAKSNFDFFSHRWNELKEQFVKQNLLDFAETADQNAKLYANCQMTTLEQALNAVSFTKPLSQPIRNAKRDNARNLPIDQLEKYRAKYSALQENCKKLAEKFESFLGKDFATLVDQTSQTVPLVDKLFEILQKFEDRFFHEKKLRGGLDFNDLEHLTLKILLDSEANAELKSRYKYIFVDEYQDINDVQQQIIDLLCGEKNLFAVGDIKQSIYAFRGCDCNIFAQKYKDYKSSPQKNALFEMNENFRSNVEILNFANSICSQTMTESFGNIDYKTTSKLTGKKQPICSPSIFVDIADIPAEPKDQPDEIYDITAQTNKNTTSSIAQGKILAYRINQLVDSGFKYSDIAILSPALKDNALDIYNTLIEQNIPVSANFKLQGFLSKEIRDIVNFLRVVDNPQNDVALAGAILSHFCGLDENQLAEVCICVEKENKTLFERVEKYIGDFKNEISQKLSKLLDLIEKLRFFAHSNGVDSVVLELVKMTNFNLYVLGLPNGQIRIKKLYNFVDGLKAKPYSESVDKFLGFVDQADDGTESENSFNTNAVKMMTMHGSKGLEFPAVFLVDCDREFLYDKGILKFNKQCGIALDFHDFNTMRVSKSLGSFAVEIKNKLNQNEEQMRLLYVALTRGCQVLGIVSSKSELLFSDVEKPISSCTSFSQWILPALKNIYKNDLVDGFCRDGINLKIWDFSKSFYINLKTNAPLLCPQQSDLNSALEKINYVYHHQKYLDLPTKVVSSALDKAYLDIESEQPTFAVLAEEVEEEKQTPSSEISKTKKQLLGSAYHKVLENSKLKATVEDISKTIDMLLTNGSISPECAEQIDKTLLENALNNKKLLELSQNAKIYHELPFMLNTDYSNLFDEKFESTQQAQAENSNPHQSAKADRPDSLSTATVAKQNQEKIILQGVIDLLIQHPDKVIVVDFKFVKNSSFIKKNYQRQLDSYRLAVKEILKANTVDCYVLSIADNKLIQM